MTDLQQESTPGSTLSQESVPTGLLMSLLSTSIVAWLIIGALAYGDEAFTSPDVMPFFTLILSMVMVACLVVFAAIFQDTRPSRGGVYYTAAITGFGASTVYSVTSAGWGNVHRRIFWSYGGIFGGVLVEALTGGYTLFARRLESSLPDGQRETRAVSSTEKRQ